MPRDPELIRKLLLFFDAKPGPEMVKVAPIEGYDDNTIKYHQVLLYDAGYLRCEAMRSGSTPDRVYDVWPFDLTWSGHEFLDEIRNPYVWSEVLQKLKDEGLASASVDVLKKLADGAMRKKLNLG